MRYIHGKDCSMTLLRDGVYTVLPYTLETLRCVNRRIPLSETMGKKKRAVFQENGKAIRGWFITLISRKQLIVSHWRIS
ncbi:MAG: hypothetical protein K5930_11300 [Treponemataceae bacterium]|nr:hypothetical protein [Treponemataceae bacterium]